MYLFIWIVELHFVTCSISEQHINQKKRKTMSKRSSISVDATVADRLRQIKDRGDMTYTELIQFLLDARDFRTKKSGANKAELVLKDWLAFGTYGEITGTKLKNIAGVNYNTCKKVMELYKEEIETYNKKNR